MILTNTIIKGSNCIEHVLCNILLNMGLDYSMLFTDSWNILVNKDSSQPLRDRLDIYHFGYYELFDNLSKYYGVEKKCYAWPDSYQKLESLIKGQEYLCLRIQTASCPWLIAIEGMEEYHYLLVTGIDRSGLYGYDYSTAAIKKLGFENLEKGAIELLAFHKVHNPIDAEVYQLDLNRKLYKKVKTHQLRENIRLLAIELDDSDSVLSELTFSDLIISPLLRKISYIGFGKRNFLYQFETGVLANKFDLEKERECLLDISSNWLFLNKLFTKYALSKNKDILHKIKAKLLKFSILEEELLKQFIKKIWK